MYHGILIAQEFNDINFPEKFKSFAVRQGSEWKIYGVEIEDSELEKTIKEMQLNMLTDKPWYAHLYNDNELIVVFKNKVFHVKPHKSTWTEVLDYGKTLGIPEEQLDFWPNRFQDEPHYFS